MGKKKQPTYRLVAVDKRAPRDGSFIENLGHYNPRTEPSTISFKEEKVLDWLKKGAAPSDTVMRLLKEAGIWQKFENGKKTTASTPVA
jgi:small subunit ribosomal protein S16